MSIMFNNQVVVTIEDVAKKAGYSYNTVVNVLGIIRSGRKSSYSKECMEKIGSAAEELGYDVELAKKAGSRQGVITRMEKSKVARAKKAEQKRLDYLRKHNFESKEAETLRMRHLREQGYTNLEIKNMIGRSYQCVLDRIGYQPEEYTAESFRLAGEIRRMEAESRVARVRLAKEAALRKEIAHLESENEAARLRIVARNEEIERSNKLNAEELQKIEENTRRLETLKTGA